MSLLGEQNSFLPSLCPQSLVHPLWSGPGCLDGLLVGVALAELVDETAGWHPLYILTTYTIQVMPPYLQGKYYRC